MRIERDADSVARCFLLEAELFENGWDAVYEGEVTGVIGAGAFVAFGDGYEGMLPVRRLVGDWWELNELETMLIGAGSGERIRLGDPVRVRVEKVDCAAGTRRPRASLMSAHSAQTASGTRPARIRSGEDLAAEADREHRLERGGDDQHGDEHGRRGRRAGQPQDRRGRGHHRAHALREALGRAGDVLRLAGRDLHREARQRAQRRARSARAPRSRRRAGSAASRRRSPE